MIETLYNFTIYDPSTSITIPLTMDDFIYQESDGLAMPTIDRFMQSSPTQHGALDKGFRLQPRTFTFQITVRAASPTEFYSQRDTIISVLRPSYYSSTSTLRITLPDNITIYSIPVYCTDLTFKSIKGSINQTAKFKLLAPNPVFTKYTSATSTYFYQADIGVTKTITYPGKWIAYPYPFSIRGPITDPVITNSTTLKSISLLSYSVVDMGVVNIDLRAGYKTIKYGATSLMQYVPITSDFDNFYLAPNPEAPNGVNTFLITGTGVGANTRILIGYTPTTLAL